MDCQEYVYGPSQNVFGQIAGRIQMWGYGSAREWEKAVALYVEYALHVGFQWEGPGDPIGEFVWVVFSVDRFRIRRYLAMLSWEDL